jgi:hypothetical protein
LKRDGVARPRHGREYSQGCNHEEPCAHERIIGPGSPQGPRIAAAASASVPKARAGPIPYLPGSIGSNL